MQIIIKCFGRILCNSVVRFLREKNVIFIEKKNNPFTPEVRLIEYFWYILKRIAYENNWEAQTIDQLK